MAPESNAPAAGNTAVAPRQNVTVPAPAAGANTTVDSSAGGQLQLTFDPSTANVDRSGNDLTFQVDGGGTVTVRDFFAVGDESLPSLRLPDGTVVASTDFFEGSGLDMTTAAGPGAGAGAAGSGAGEYADDPGSGILGIDRFGKLGTDWWGRSFERGEEYLGNEGPGGTVSFNSYVPSDPDDPDVPTYTDPSGKVHLVNAMFEDGRSHQHLYGDSDGPDGINSARWGEIIINADLSPGTSISGIAMSNFPVGTQLEVRDADGNVIMRVVIEDVTDVVTIDPAYIEGLEGVGTPSGLFVMPPADYDGDLNIETVVELSNANGSTAVTPPLDIIVDAVADKPDTLEGGIVAEAHLTLQENTETPKGEMTSGEATDVGLDVKARFGDYKDGSESHSFKVEGVPSEWTLNVDAFFGNPVSVVDNGDGTKTYVFDVTAQVTANGGVIDHTLSFNPHDWTDQRLDSGAANPYGPAQIKVTAIAEETPSDDELVRSNNYSETVVGDFTVSLTEDTPDIIDSVGLVLGTDEKAGLQNELDFTGLDASTKALANAQTNATPLGASQDTFRFDLHSDGIQDGKKADADSAPEDQPTVLFSGFPGGGELFAKLPGDPHVDGGGYHALSVQSVTDQNGNTTLTYSWMEGGVKHVALVVVLEPTFNADGTGSANMTVIQYAALQHADGRDVNDKNLNFTIKVTDNDGDSTSINAVYTVKDDIPDAVDDATRVGNEATRVSGNVLDGTTDSAFGSAGMSRDDYGSDGRASQNGLVWKDAGGKDFFELKLTSDLALDTSPDPTVVHKAGDTITLFRDPQTGQLSDAHGNDCGTLELNSDGSFTYTKPAGVTFEGDLATRYTITDADKDPDTATLTITVKDSGITIPDDPKNPDTPDDDILQGTVNILVNEAGLPKGTDRANPEQTIQEGSFNIKAPDGLSTLSIGGHRILFEEKADGSLVFKGVEGAAGNVVEGKYGDLQITGITGDPQNGYEVSYKYTLTDNARHQDDPSNLRNKDIVDDPGIDDDGPEDFAIVMIDKDGDSFKGNIKVTIIDDAPDAVDDKAIIGNEAVGVSGNVVTGEILGSVVIKDGDVVATVKPKEGAHDMQKDDFGADEAASPGMVWKDAGGNDSFKLTFTEDFSSADGKVAHKINDEITLTLKGNELIGSDGVNYGKLVLNPDGSFVYTKPAGEAFKGDVKVKYTITDSDDDPDTATLTIKVMDSPIGIIDKPEDPDDNNPDNNVPKGSIVIEVNEAGLERGTTPGAVGVDGKTPIIEANGYFRIEARDGMVELKIGDTKVNLDGGSTTIKGTQYGDLEIVKVEGDAAGGYKVYYKYTLKDEASHNDNASERLNYDMAKPEQLPITMRDADGDTSSSTLVVRIKDDAPIANNDTGVLDETTQTEISGNVLFNDLSGADGWKGGGWSDGKGGFDSKGEGGGQAVTGYVIDLDSLPVDYKIMSGNTLIGTNTGATDGKTSPLTPGQSYTVVDGNGVLQGTFTLAQNGEWKFSKGDDIVKNFGLKVTYTVKDADGDTASANLDVSVKAAPLYVGISGTKVVFESTDVTAHAGHGDDYAHGVATYTLQVYQFNGATAGANARPEAIDVSLRIDFKGASLADFDVAKWQALNPGIQIVAIDVNNGTATIRIPADNANGSLDLRVPILEDAIGGKGTSSGDNGTSNDGPAEDYTVTITGVTGAPGGGGVDYLTPAEAAGKGAQITQDTTIVDDGAIYKNGKWEYASNELTEHLNTPGAAHHPLDGPVVGLKFTAIKDGTLEFNEGSSTFLQVTFNEFTGTGKSGDWTGKELSENMTVNFTLNVGSSGLAEGIASGATTITFGGNNGITLAQLQQLGGSCTINGIDGSGNISVTLVLPKGMTAGDLGKVFFTVSSANDSVVESDQLLTATVTGSTGNESLYDSTAAKVEVKDVLNEVYLKIAGNETKVEGQDLHFTLSLASDANGGNAYTGTPQGPVHTTLSFDKKTADAVSDYLKDVKSGMSDDALTALKNTMFGSGSSVKIISVTMDASGGFDIQLEIPASAWESGNKITITVPTVADSFYEGNESFNVTIVSVDNAVGDQEIKGHTGKGTGTIKDLAGAELSIVGTPVIYEDPNHGAEVKGSDKRPDSSYDANGDKLTDATEGDAGEKWNVARYTVQVDAPGFEKTGGTGNGKVDETFTFKVNLNSGTATYGEDFEWLWQAQGLGAKDPAAWTADELTALNTFLKLPVGVTVVGVSADGSTLTLQVAAGTEYSKITSSIQVDVVAVDDMYDDSGEKYTVTISTPSLQGTVVIGDKNTVETTILDDEHTTHANGFQVGIGGAEANESEPSVGVPIILYTKYGEGDASGVLTAVKPSDYKPGDPVFTGPQGETLYLKEGYDLDPKGISITLGFGDGTATGNADYDANTRQHWLDPNGYEVVKLPDPPAGPGGYTLQQKVQIALTDDQFTEGPEYLDVSIENVSGNESRPLGSSGHNGKEWTGSKPSAPVTITDDDTDTGSTARDGHSVLFFGPESPVKEPNPHFSDSREVDYALRLDLKTVEPVVVMLEFGGSTDDYEAGSNVFTKDSVFTTQNLKDLGFMDDAGNFTGKYATWTETAKGSGEYTLTNMIDESGKSVSLDGYFVIVPKDSMEVNFTVNIKHDNDEKNVSGGVDDDKTSKEEIVITIKSVTGSEVKLPPEGERTSTAPIEDDMRGPVLEVGDYDRTNSTLKLEFEDLGLRGAIQEETITITLTVYDPATAEPMGTVTIDVTGPLANNADVEISNLKTLFESQNSGKTFPSGTLIVKVADVVGGEAQPDPDVRYYPAPGGPGTEPIVTVKDFTASDITEGDAREPGAPVEYAIDLGFGDKVPDNVSFTLKVINGSTDDTDLEHASGGYSIQVNLTAKDLQAIKDSGGKLVIMDDGNGDGTPKLAIKVGDQYTGLKGGSTVSGDLPQAVGDGKLEETEQFSTVIIPGKAVHVTDGVAETKVLDNTHYKLMFDGKTTVTEGDGLETYTARLVWVDEAGNCLDKDGNITTDPKEYVTVKPEGSLSFDLDYAFTSDGGKASPLYHGTVGRDVSGPKTITIGPDGTGSIKVAFPDDYLSDGDHTLVITGSVKTVDGFPVSNTCKGVESPSITIEENPNGPIVSVTALADEIWEGGKNSTSTSFAVRVNTVPDEDMEITLKLSGNPDQLKYCTKNGDEWDSATGGDKYLRMINADGTFKDYVKVNADGTVTVTIEKGHSQVLVEVIAKQDTLTETDSKVSMSIDGVTGAEGQAGPNASATVKINDDKNGPKVSLTADAAKVTEDAGQVDFSLKMTGAADEAVVVKLTLGTGWQDSLRLSPSDDFKISLDGGNTWITPDSFDKNAGTFTVTVPAGSTGVKVSLPLKDNAISGDPDVKVSLNISNVTGGEASSSATFGFDEVRAQETGNTLVYKLDSALDKSATDSTITVELDNVKLADLSSVYLYGKKITDLTQDGNKVTFTVEVPAGTNMDATAANLSNALKLTFKGNNIDAVKEALKVTATGVTGKASVTISDDPDHLDGPKFSVVDSVSSSVAEGAAVAFTIHSDVKAGYETVTDPKGIALSFKLTGTAATDSFADTVTVQMGGETYTATLKDGAYTVTIPQGKTLGDLTVSVTPGKDSVIGTDKTIGIEVTGVQNGEASLGDKKASAEVSVTEADTGKLLLAQDDATVDEGGNLTFNLNLRDGSNARDMTTADPIAVTLLVSGLTADIDLDALTNWTKVNDGEYTVKVTIPQGSGGTAVTIPTLLDGMIEGDESLAVTVKIASIDHQLVSALDSGGQIYTFTIEDADYAKVAAYGHDLNDVKGMALVEVDGSHTHDGSQAAVGQVILGSGEADVITGTAHDDIIHGGGGNDIIRGGADDDQMYGGDGKDTFLWLADDFGSASAPATDTIFDFQYKSDLICFEDVFGQAGTMDTLLDNLNSFGFDNVTKTVSIDAGNGMGLEAQLMDNNQLMLTLKSGNDVVQTIDVRNSDQSFMDNSVDLTDSATQAAVQEMLKEMIKDGNS